MSCHVSSQHSRAAQLNAGFRALVLKLRKRRVSPKTLKLLAGRTGTSRAATIGRSTTIRRLPRLQRRRPTWVRPQIGSCGGTATSRKSSRAGKTARGRPALARPQRRYRRRVATSKATMRAGKAGDRSATLQRQRRMAAVHGAATGGDTRNVAVPGDSPNAAVAGNHANAAAAMAEGSDPNEKINAARRRAACGVCMCGLPRACTCASCAPWIDVAELTIRCAE